MGSRANVDRGCWPGGPNGWYHCQRRQTNAVGGVRGGANRTRQGPHRVGGGTRAHPERAGWHPSVAVDATPPM
eukprot:1278597-Lingulodinium_polyedra.AAC.1